MIGLMTNKNGFTPENNWWGPSRELSYYKSVVNVEMYNMSSSAGNWGGWFQQKLNGTYYLIMFWQENCYPGRGFNYTTDERPFASSKKKFTVDEGNQILSELIDTLYGN